MNCIFWTVAILANGVLIGILIRVVLADRKLTREREAREMKKDYESRQDWIRFDREIW
jgi:hypothetical protein